MKSLKFKYQKNHREQIWDDLAGCEHTLQNLKSIVQNECECSEDDWYEWGEMKGRLVKQLDAIQNKLRFGYDYV